MKKASSSLFKNKLFIFVGMGIIKGIGKLPPTFQLVMGRGLARLIKPLLGSHKRNISINLNLCFPERSEAWKKDITNQYFQSFGMGLIEFCMAGFTPTKRLPSCEILGLEHIEKLQKNKRPIIFISAHFTNFIMLGRLLSEQLPFHAVFRPQRDLTFNRLLSKYALDKGVNLLKPKLSSIVKQLQKGESVLYFPDQDNGARHSIFAPFFGVSAATVKALAFLVKTTGAAVVPAFCYRKLKPLIYQLEISSPLLNYPTEDEIADATSVNKIIEKAIEKQPELYFWYYKRFRTRPEGEKAIY